MHYFTAGGGPEAFVRHCLSILTACSVLAWPTLAGAQAPTEEPTEALGVDSNGNSLLTLDFGTGEAEIINGDGGLYQKLRSIETVANVCAGRLDVVVADPNGGSIRRYAQGSDISDLELCNAGNPNCPQEPTGVSLSIGAVLGTVDNGFPVFEGSGGHETTAVWVFPDAGLPGRRLW